MSATERVATFGSRSTILGWAAISPSRKSSRFADHRVHRRFDYPASLGLDRDLEGIAVRRGLASVRGERSVPAVKRDEVLHVIVFGAIDHAVDEIVGWHTAKIGDRWAALEPIRQGVRHAFGAFGKEIARGLRLRCDWGPQYIADAWINEVKWLGITISPSYVGEPQCNGVAERFMRTLKEQCLYWHQFTSLAEARTIISEFIERYNTQWLIERRGHQTPAGRTSADAIRSCRNVVFAASCTARQGWPALRGACHGRNDG